MGCGGSSGAGPAAQPGYAAQAMRETDAAAETFLPAAVTGLRVQVFTGRSGFVECDLTGWRYEGDGDLVGTPDPADTDTLTGLMAAQDLEVEVRDDGSVLGRRGELSLLVGAPTGSTAAGTTLRHYTFTHACAPYADEDVQVATSAPETDYAAFVAPQARYAP